MFNNSAHAKTRSGGFTAIELMTAIVLVGIIASLAMPSMDGYLDRTRTRRALDELVADVSYARLLAVRNGRPTAIRIEDDASYRIEVMTQSGAWTVERAVDLGAEYPGVALAGGVQELEFSSRGLLTSFGTEKFVKMSSNGVRDSVFVSPAGRVYRAY